MKKLFLFLCLVVLALPLSAVERQRLNFNGSWLINVGDMKGADQTSFDDSPWGKVTLPHAFNEKEAFKVSIENLTDTIIWYRKHFNVSETEGRKYFIEFEGARFGADVWLNGHKLGYSENGVMAFGFDLTPYIIKGENVIAVRCDNSWHYHERTTGSPFQWNDRNFNANYGGLPKNVWLHITDPVYQTFPLYSSFKTTGTYVYAKDFNIPEHTATICVESQVKNETDQPVTRKLDVVVSERGGKEVCRFSGNDVTIPAHGLATLTAEKRQNGLHFWSWGYGYLYNVETSLSDDHKGRNLQSDKSITTTGFRKTHFGEGKIWLNDRVFMVHGYAQRTSNEWPGLGIDVPAWLSDYSNHLVVESNGNMVRWMHVCPSKQDIESCDRVGLPEAMPAGDAEKDVTGRRWEQRLELMRDAIVYNRNNPSILFYESGNRGVSKEHMLEMKAIRDEFDPHGGRASGSREMLDVDVAEYGGEMLYINKSKKHPMWSMEYCRDEGLRKYWDEYSYPFHKEGDGPLYRGKPATDYNHNMDEMTKVLVKSWNDYFLERPGTGKRVSSGGVKIVFSDTNTHHRGESNYRTSGVVDAMRIPKDGFFAHQAMWDGWVNPEKDHTYIVGHWNYDAGTVKPVYVVSTGDSVRLLVNGKDQGAPVRSNTFLFTFPKVKFEAGTIEAISYRAGEGRVPYRNGIYQEVSRDKKETAGAPDHLKLTAIQNPLGFKADGSDVTLVQFEVVDKQGRRCPLDNRLVTFNQWGEGEWIGGIGVKPSKKNVSKAEQASESSKVNAKRKADGLLDASDSESTSDNDVGCLTLPVECGVNRVIVRSTPVAGNIRISASADGLKPVYLDLKTEKVEVEHYAADRLLPCRLDRGETPSTPSYKDIKEEINIVSATAGSNTADVKNSFDDNERSEWKSDGKKENAWISYKLAKKAKVDEITLKLSGWRSLHYPLAVYESGKKVWQRVTDTSLGYVHIYIDKPVLSNTVKIVMFAPSTSKEEVGDTKELAGGKAAELDRISTGNGKVELRIVEVDMLHKL